MSKNVCVIGAGLAGGIIASRLASRGHVVTLVECGSAPAPLLPEDEDWQIAKVKSPFTRGRGLGGTSNFWHGGLTTLAQSDVDGLVAGGGRAKSPIPYRELCDYYETAIEILRGNAALSLQDIERPADESKGAFTFTNRAFSAKALVYPDKPFSSRPLIAQAERFHGLRVIDNFEVKRLLGDGPRRVRYADGVDLVQGTRRRLAADIFVLSAGGLGSPKVLLQSRQGLAPLEQLPIGRGFIDHPTGFVFKAKLRRKTDLGPFFGVGRNGYKQLYGFTLKPEHLGEAYGRNHILLLRPAISMKDPASYDFLKRKLSAYRGRFLRPMELGYLLWHADLLFDAVNFKYGFSSSTSYVSGLVFAEQEPEDESGIFYSGNGRFDVRWRVTDKDCRSLDKFLKTFFENYSDQFERVRIFEDMHARLDSAAHHSGACRISANAGEGVVDRDFRVFGMDNLYVSDGSTLAYSGHANTGLTIAALALRFCDVVERA